MVYRSCLGANSICWFRFTITVFILSTPSIKVGSVSTNCWEISCILSQTWGYSNYCYYASAMFYLDTWALIFVVATTRRNSTCDMLTSAKLSVGYLVVGITRELDKESLLHCSSIYINITWSVLQQYLLALMSMLQSHVLLLIHHAFTSRPLCHIHVP